MAYPEHLIRIIENDKKIAEDDAARCAVCTASDIKDCPNSFKGNQYVIQEGSGGIPSLAARPCKVNIRMRAEFRRKELLGATGLGERWNNRTFETFVVEDHNREAFEKARAYADSFLESRKWLILSGAVGTGKTHLAAAILQYATVKFECEGLYTTSVKMLSRLRSSYQASDTRSIMEGLENAIPLVIDDLGKERENDSKTKEIIFEILNSRYESDSPTIITTNLDGEEIIKYYGLPIMSRLQEVGIIVVTGGPDFRMKEA